MNLFLFFCLILLNKSFLVFQELPQESASPPTVEESSDQLSMIIKLHGDLGELEEEIFQADKLSETDGLSHLHDLADIDRRNRSNIRTWGGIADTSFWQRKNGDTPYLNRFEFSVDQQADSEKVKVFSLQNNDQNRLVAIFSRFVMRIGGDIYEVRPHLGHNDQIHKVMITHGRLSPGFEAGDFSPLHYFAIHDSFLEDRVTRYEGHVKKGFAKVTVWKGPRYSWVEFRMLNQRDQVMILEIDRERGATISRYVSRSTIEFERKVCTYQEVSGAWVPERYHRAVIYRNEKDQFQDRSHLTIFKNRVNVEFPEDAFQFSGLGLGDELAIEDKRNGTRYNYRKDRTPEASSPKLPDVQDGSDVDTVVEKMEAPKISVPPASMAQGAPNQTLKNLGLLIGSTIIFYSILILFSPPLGSPDSSAKVKRMMGKIGILGTLLLLGAGLLVFSGTLHAKRQLEANKTYGDHWQCGHWVLFRISQNLGAIIAIDDVNELLPVHSDGNSFLELKRAFEAIGFDVDAKVVTIKELESMPAPFVAKLNNPDHFVAVMETNSTGLLIFDSAGKKRLVDWNKIKFLFSGNVLQVRSTYDQPLPRIIERPKNDSPAVQFKTLLADKGIEEPQNEIFRFEFPFKNFGTEPLLIHNVHVNCSCIKVNFPEITAPGESGIITAIYNTNMSGNLERFNQELTVECNDPDFPFVHLTAQGVVNRKVHVSPRVVQFGDVLLWTTKERFITIRIAGLNPVETWLDEVSCDLSDVTAEWVSVEDYRVICQEQFGQEVEAVYRESDSRLRILRVTVNPKTLVEDGHFEMRGVISVKTSNPSIPKVSIPIQYRPKKSKINQP